ncbi:MAG: hypothetical protein N2234_02990, partial [Planctomycetota bacterium]|nr:hypothetical protein [Planctomycetota bacterium]
MEVKLYHHIYTSSGGYKTVYSTKNLPSDILDRLERYSTLVYPRVGGIPFFAIFPISEDKICYSKAFRGGVDHVGRPKACVHNIVLDSCPRSENNTPFL